MALFQVSDRSNKFPPNELRGEHEKLEQILPQISNGCDSEYGRTLFHDVVEGLNQRSRTKTAVAPLNAHWNTVVVLLKAGYRPDATDSQGNSPLHLLFHAKGDLKARLPFLEKFLKLPTLLLNKQNQQGHTILHLAPYSDLPLLQHILENYKKVVDFSVRDLKGATPFHHALCNGKKKQ